MHFTLIGHPIASVLVGVGLGSVTGGLIADTGLINFQDGIWNDKIVTGVAYGASIGAVPGMLTGMGDPRMGKARREATRTPSPSPKEQENNLLPLTIMHPDDATDFEDFRSWKAYIREREAEELERDYQR